MDTPEAPETSDKEVLSQVDVERVLAQVAEQGSGTGVPRPESPNNPPAGDSIQPYDFRNPAFLSANDLRKLRVQHETIIQALMARLSMYLRLEFGLQMSQLQTLSYQKFVDGLANPCHLTLFKAEPLRGICVLEVNPRLGLAIVDRLMGGPGHATSAARDLSEMEIALLDQAIQIILGEWCNHWSKIQELRPMLLGHENTGRFLQTSSPDTVMLALSMEARIGECVERIQIGFPYTTVEPLLCGLSSTLNQAAEDSASPGHAIKPRWKKDFDNVRIRILADWAGVRLTARELASLKVGDVIPLPREFSNQVRVCVAKSPKFRGRVGTCENRWAIELTEILKP